MLRWCSYCQHFLGETPDYENLRITHGVCASCEPKALAFSEENFQLAEFLRDIQHRLYEAGRRNDLTAAEQIIEDAAGANIRSVDILIGIVAPMLYQVGEDWKRGVLSVAGEHRFTSFCNEVFNLVASKTRAVMPASATAAREPGVLLMNAPGNKHTLAIRIITLWLWDRGVPARMLDMPPTLKELTTQVIRTQPKFVLVSMALAEQCMDVTTIAESIAALPSSNRPRVIVGGFAVKFGLVSAIPGADLMGDISALQSIRLD
jgi:methanogenic corrinoid protein MtbC1